MEWMRTGLRHFFLALTIGMVAGCGRSPADDMVIERDGKVVRGDLAGCAGDSCTMNGTPVARATIVLIGLHGNQKSPKIRDPLRDELQLVDESIVAATMTSVDSAAVVTDKDSYPRERVAWIYLAPKPPAGAQGAPASSGADVQPGITYEWTGTINVGNKYEGREGQYKWQASYTLTFVEVDAHASVTDAAGKSYDTNAFIPSAFAYSISADETLDKHVYNPGSVTMSGNASGEITAAVAKQKNVLRGELIRFDGAAAAGTPPPTSFDSDDVYYRVNYPPGPGWFEISITFAGFKGRDNGSDKEWRALYQGIARGGQAALAFADPDADFINWVPAWMPEGTVVIGRLNSPDQTDVHGSATFPRKTYSDPQDREQVTVSWEFRRKPQ
jgi:hypothetical protein